MTCEGVWFLQWMWFLLCGDHLAKMIKMVWSSIRIITGTDDGDGWQWSQRQRLRWKGQQKNAKKALNAMLNIEKNYLGLISLLSTYSVLRSRF